MKTVHRRLNLLAYKHKLKESIFFFFLSESQPKFRLGVKIGLGEVRLAGNNCLSRTETIIS